MKEFLTDRRQVAVATLLALGSVAACGSDNSLETDTRIPKPFVGYVLPGQQMNFFTNGTATISRIENSELTGSFTLLECSEGSLLTDTDPLNHNDSDVPRERKSVTVATNDQKCADDILTPADFEL